jgi:hypothetical protein
VARDVRGLGVGAAVGRKLAGDQLAVRLGVAVHMLNADAS